MAWTNYQLFLCVLLVSSGTINTIAAKWADRQVSEGNDGKSRQFNHPFTQTTFMFFGETLNIGVYFLFYCLYRKKGEDDATEEITILRGNRRFNPTLLFPPAMFDMLATSLMYMGLNFTYASSFQMLRGAVIVFTGLLSWLCLHNKMETYRWAGILLIVLGLSMVGIADFLPTGEEPEDSNSITTTESPHKLAFTTENVILGDLLIVGAQLLAACQFVWEEKYVSKHNIPALLAVGWEGIFGVAVLTLCHFPFYFISVPKPFGDNSRGVLEDGYDAFIMMGNNIRIIVGLVGTAMSIAFFNFSGVSVTKELSATTRMVMDSVRTIFIWAFCLAFDWQDFQFLQLVGFVILLLGMCVYNDLLVRPGYFKLRDYYRTRRASAAEVTDEAKPTTSK